MKPLLFAALLSAAPEVSRTELLQTIDAFSPLDRLSGGEGERLANEYLEKKLAEYGVPFETHQMELLEAMDVAKQILSSSSGE
jgi:20S proteasome alpha/beta subunit